MLKRTFLTLAAAASVTLAAPALTHAQTEGTPAMLAPTTSGYAPVDGTEVFYQVYGSGDPIVLLHGGFGAIEMFGPVIGMLAEHHTVIGMDLQAHGRTAPMDRPMSFEAMADDVAGLIGFLGYDKADVLGYSTGGGVALRLGLQHPEVIDKLILVSTPYARAGWHDYNLQGMDMIGPGAVEPMKQTPMYVAFQAVNPDPDKNWPLLIEKQGDLVKRPYDYSAELKDGLTVPTMLVVGDWDAVRTEHVAKFFNLLGGGKQDGLWDRSGMNANRLAILPDETHYSIFRSPKLGEAALGFIDAK